MKNLLLVLLCWIASMQSVLRRLGDRLLHTISLSARTIARSVVAPWWLSQGRWFAVCRGRDLRDPPLWPIIRSGLGKCRSVRRLHQRAVRYAHRVATWGWEQTILVGPGTRLRQRWQHACRGILQQPVDSAVQHSFRRAVVTGSTPSEQGSSPPASPLVCTPAG